LLARQLGRGVGRDCAGKGVAFGEGDFFIHTINRGRRGEDEILDFVVAAGIEEIESAIDVGGEVELGRLDGWPNSGAGSKVNDGVKVALGKAALDEDGIANVSFDKGHLVFKAGDIEPLNLGIIVVIEVIDDGDIVSLCEERFHEMRADEPCASGDQVVHDKSLRSGKAFRRVGIEIVGDAWCEGVR